MYIEVPIVAHTFLELPSIIKDPSIPLSTQFITLSLQPSYHTFSDKRITHIQIIPVIHNREQ